MLHGRYSVLEVIGQGRGGVVRRGYDHILQREVAVKTMADTADSRREVEFLGQIRHPQVVEFYDAIMEGGRIHLIMELGIGGTVRHKRLTLPELRQIALAAGEALRHLHELGFAHCDVKPSHLVFARNGQLKLVDFGTASPIGEQAHGGTPGYMAPEMRQRPAACPALDVFSLGKTLLTLARENRIRLPKELRTVLKTATSSDPKERFAAMEDFLEALRGTSTCPERPRRLALSSLRAAAAAFVTMGLLAFGAPWAAVYPAVFSVFIGPAIVGISALYSPVLAVISLAVVMLPCLAGGI